MKNRALQLIWGKAVIGLILLLLLVSCATVPLTGRKQLNLIPEGEMLSMSYTQYDQVKKESRLSTNQAEITMIKNVGTRISQAAESFLREKGVSMKFDWEFILIDDDQVANAWCMPGGKVAFYTGILPITKTETGIAVVMGHEVAHALAKHGNERMSQGLLVQLGGLTLAKALESKPEATQSLYMQAFGLGAQVGFLLPYSRKHESEADHIGLILMAKAGYNPQEAVSFWERMSQSGGQAPPEFLSTHPANQTRINDLKKLLPEAMKYYKK
ncbi:M48 family metallopeptidase [candidate division KSB1 bacterium]|nr:M48 family metallopeptidase [candidate division KSB1 bacterium]